MKKGALEAPCDATVRSLSLPTTPNTSELLKVNITFNHGGLIHTSILGIDSVIKGLLGMPVVRQLGADHECSMMSTHDYLTALSQYGL